MKVMPTLEGGLKIDVESEQDFRVLEMIVKDAGSPDEVTADLAQLMQQQEDWNELITPDLWEMVYGQFAIVAKAVSAAKVDNILHISSDSADAWYGALNQARLQLEREHGLHQWTEEEDGLSELLQNILIRDRFYCMLQTLLLDFVMGGDL